MHCCDSTDTLPCFPGWWNAGCFGISHQGPQAHSCCWLYKANRAGIAWPGGTCGGALLFPKWPSRNGVSNYCNWIPRLSVLERLSGEKSKTDRGDCRTCFYRTPPRLNFSGLRVTKINRSNWEKANTVDACAPQEHHEGTNQSHAHWDIVCPRNTSWWQCSGQRASAESTTCSWNRFLDTVTEQVGQV